MNNKRTLIIILVVILTTMMLFSGGIYLFFTRTVQGKRLVCSINHNFCEKDEAPEPNDNPTNDSIPPNDSPNEPPEEPEEPTNPGTFEIELPKDMPFSITEMKRLATKAQERLNVSYVWDESKPNWSEKQFKEYIDPYLTLYLASMEYSFEKYGDVFVGQNPSLEDRRDLRLTVYEKCTDMSVGYTQEVCSDVKMIGSVNPFTYGVSFYINTQHPEYSNEFLIDIGMHETIHLLQYTYDDGYAGGTIPVWYKESMAVGLAYSAPSKEAIYKRDYDQYGFPQTLMELNEWYSSGGDTLEELGKMRAAYYVGGLFFEFLMDRVELKDYLTIMPKRFSNFPELNEFDREFSKVFGGKTSQEMYTEFVNQYNQ